MKKKTITIFVSLLLLFMLSNGNNSVLLKAQSSEHEQLVSPINQGTSLWSNVKSVEFFQSPCPKCEQKRLNLEAAQKEETELGDQIYYAQIEIDQAESTLDIAKDRLGKQINICFDTVKDDVEQEIGVRTIRQILKRLGEEAWGALVHIVSKYSIFYDGTILDCGYILGMATAVETLQIQYNGLVDAQQKRKNEYKKLLNKVAKAEAAYNTCLTNNRCLQSTNIAPIAMACCSKTVVDTDKNGSESVTLDGSKSSDSDGIIVSYLWYEGNTLLSQSSGDNPSATVTLTLNVGLHTISLIVVDNWQASSLGSIVGINVIEPPDPPPPADTNTPTPSPTATETPTPTPTLTSTPTSTPTLTPTPEVLSFTNQLIFTPCKYVYEEQWETTYIGGVAVQTNYHLLWIQETQINLVYNEQTNGERPIRRPIDSTCTQRRDLGPSPSNPALNYGEVWTTSYLDDTPIHTWYRITGCTTTSGCFVLVEAETDGDVPPPPELP
ncbi:MAG: hypothetical protein GC179_09210 [Anaerolineaceae bacterium]|nr:hypothetical protein [Anaerolineaceae bacterium]